MHQHSTAVHSFIHAAKIIILELPKFMIGSRDSENVPFERNVSACTPDMNPKSWRKHHDMKRITTGYPLIAIILETMQDRLIVTMPM